MSNLHRRVAALDAAHRRAKRADADVYVASISPLERAALVEMLAAARGEGVQWRGDGEAEAAYARALDAVGDTWPPDRRALDAALALVEVVEARGYAAWARLYIAGKVGR